jgi:hypothetical protein
LHLVGYLYYWQMGFNSVFKGLMFKINTLLNINLPGTLAKTKDCTHVREVLVLFFIRVAGRKLQRRNAYRIYTFMLKIGVICDEQCGQQSTGISFHRMLRS